MKKLLSIALACATVLCLAAPAFAADTTPVENDLKMTGSVISADINCAVETGDKKVVLNPYGLTVDTTDLTKAASGDTETSNDTLLSTPLRIVNLGETDVVITPTVTVEVANKTITLANAPFDATVVADGAGLTPKAATNKSAFLYLKMSNGCTFDTEVKSAFPDAAAKKYVKGDTVLKVGANAIKGSVSINNKKADDTTTFANLKAADFADGNKPVCEFQVLGQSNGKSTVRWETGDTIGVSFTLDIKPTILDAPAAP